jgi:hypothetical protein
MRGTIRSIVQAWSSTIVITLVIFGSMPPHIYGQSFTPGNLVILQVGPSTSGAVSLVEVSPPGGPVRTINVPSTGPNALVLDQTQPFEGCLSLSADGRFLTFGGYRAGVSDPRTQPANVVNRAIGIVGVNGIVNTSQAISDGYNSASFRAVTTNDGSSFYLSGLGTNGSGGVRYVPNTTTTTSISLNSVAGDISTRQIQVSNGNLFVSAGVSPPGSGVYQVGAGLPTSGAPALSSSAPPVDQYHNFYFTRLGTGPTWNPTGTGDTGYDTVYTTDTLALRKFCFVNNAWVACGSVPSRSGGQFYGLAGATNGSTVNLYATTETELYLKQDTGGFDVVMSFDIAGPLTHVDQSGNLFRGIAFVPVPEPTTLVGIGGVMSAVGWRIRRWNRMRST